MVCLRVSVFVFMLPSWTTMYKYSWWAYGWKMKIHLLQSAFFICRSSSDLKDALSVELGEFRTSAMNSLGNSEYWNNLQNAVTSTFSHFSINFSNWFHRFYLFFSRIFIPSTIIKEIQFLLRLCTFRVNRQEIHLFGSDDVHYILSNIEFPCVQCPVSTHPSFFLLTFSSVLTLRTCLSYLTTFKLYSF